MAITAENARELQKLGVVKRLENAEKIREAAVITERWADIGKTISEQHDGFTLVVLARVRTEIESTLNQLKNATDPLDRERLSRSLGALCEQERILSGRPLPGSLRPRQPQRSKRSEPPANPEPEATE